MPEQPIAKARSHPLKARAQAEGAPPPPCRYAELHCVTNFTFQRGASHPDELVARASELGYRALAITDRHSLAGVVRAHVAAKAAGLKLLVGAEVPLEDAATVVLLAIDRAGYGELSKLLTAGRRRAEKGCCTLFRKDVEEHGQGLIAIGVPDEDALRPDANVLALGRAAARLSWLGPAFGPRAHLACELFDGPDDAARLRRIDRLSAATGLPTVAAGAVEAHAPERRALRDVLLAIGQGCTVADLGSRIPAHGARVLRGPTALEQAYGRRPELLERTLAIADACTFSLDELRYEYPVEGDASLLRDLVEEHAAKRWPDGMPPKVRALVEHELALVKELEYERYFLTVHEIVTFARSRAILCQGRGSAANSVVCFILGITSVDPERIDVLFERFVSRDRHEPPDIDVDFEHERREEVLQHVYERYGRERAALAATVITYRPRSAVRDVGKALGLTLDQVERLAGSVQWWDRGSWPAEALREAGFDPADPTLARTLALASEIQGFPRHLSQHVGGMVITAGRLDEMVPIENAAMEDRTVLQWDKDDLDALGILKVDCLALGMLTAIRRAFDHILETRGRSLRLDSVPAEDPQVYRMLGKADTIGVFQIESRAQMAMLPRLKPTCFYDLVIEVAIVRPGPIQGGMVHPYLRRREGLEPVVYPSEAVRSVLEKTLGVPIFQEQAMRIAVVAAGFTPGEADQLRRAMGAWRKVGIIESFEKRLVDGMLERGYAEDFARSVFRQILGFGEYGFPECVVGATRIVDADTGRWVRIDDVVTGRVAVTSTLTCSDDLRIEKRRIVGRKVSGRKAVFRVRTALGRAIVATRNHPFLTSSGWRKLALLQVGDAVACARSIRLSSNKRWKRHELVVLGGLISEGNLCHPSTFYFYTTDRKHCDEFVAAVGRFSNTVPVITRHHSCFSVRVRRVDRKHEAGAVTWAKQHGLWGCDSHSKSLPQEVFELHADDMALLLARMWDGDGHVSKSAQHASYDTVSHLLAQQVQHLLLRLGIVSRCYERNRPYRGRLVRGYVITITGEGLSLFHATVGKRLLGDEKRRRARTLARKHDGRMSKDVIPSEVAAIIRRARDAKSLTWNDIGRATGLGMREIQSTSATKSGFRRWVIDRLASHLDCDELFRLANSDVYWDKVVSIEPVGIEDTYDLEIDGNHNYLANDFVVHNSHAASFALLTYVSAWLKRYEPACFTTALLNSQPMGFYAPAQLVRDARDHGVEVRPVDVTASEWDCTLERSACGREAATADPGPPERRAERVASGSGCLGVGVSERSEDRPAPSTFGHGGPALRLGFRIVKGLSEKTAKRIVAVREAAPFRSVEDCCRRAEIPDREARILADSGAFEPLSRHRRDAWWDAALDQTPSPLLASEPVVEELAPLVAPTLAETVVADYRTCSLSLTSHPLALLRGELAARGCRPHADLKTARHGEIIRIAGLVINRQRPSTASGIIFMTLEDETGYANLIVRVKEQERFRTAILASRLLHVRGRVEKAKDVVHVLLLEASDLTALIRGVETSSRDFH